MYRIRPDRPLAYRGRRDSRTGRGPGADSREGGVAQFPRCADRPGAVSGEACAAVLARCGIRRRDRRGRRRRERMAAGRRGGRVHRSRRLRRAVRGRRAPDRGAAAGDDVRAGRGAGAGLRHVAACAAAARASAAGRDAAGAGGGGRRRAGGDRDREGAGRARDCGRVERGQARAVPRSRRRRHDRLCDRGPAAPRRRTDGRARRGRRLRSGRRRVQRGGAARDRVARPVPRGRFRGRRDSEDRAEPRAPEGARYSRRVLGRCGAARSRGARGEHAPAGAMVRGRQGAAGDHRARAAVGCGRRDRAHGEPAGQGQGRDPAGRVITLTPDPAAAARSGAALGAEVRVHRCT
ncbi:YqaE/Pmp3 family membrane protein [Burkholderia ambifaria]